ncbi:MAG: PQQ-binding-like beta-propeller repeat protein [bacterium]|nr:PQQ-binding-like beta-propeller repeat protein [bacterium]
MIAVLLTLMVAQDATGEHAWGQWRGPLATGVAPHADPPLEWSEEKNVRWKTALPGEGHSTPIVWGERVYVTTAIPFGDPVEPAPETAPGGHDNAPVTHHQRFSVLAIERKDGKTAWQTDLFETLPHERAHNTAGFASGSPVTNGEHVWAFFGSRGLYCVDTDGKLVWEKQLGHMSVKHAHGEASSPLLFLDTLVVNWDHEGDSFVFAFDAKTGKERWHKARDEGTSWATPIGLEHDERPQVVVSGSNRLRSYDLKTGAVIWECGGLSHNVVASPVTADGMVFAGSSYDRQALLAIRLAGAKGDLTTSENLAWMRRRRTPYVPSPLLYDGWLYFLHHYQNTLSRVEAKTGKEPKGPFRLAAIRNVYASPVAAAGRVYITDLDGVTVVLSKDDEPKVLATNVLDDAFSASAAIVGGELYLRGRRSLYCLAAGER